MLSFFSKKRTISEDAQKFIHNISILIDKDLQSDTYDIEKVCGYFGTSNCGLTAQVRVEVSKFLSEVKNILLRVESEQSKIQSLHSVPEGETAVESSSSSSGDKEAAAELTAITGETDLLLLLTQGMRVCFFVFLFSTTFSIIRNWTLRHVRTERRYLTVF